MSAVWQTVGSFIAGVLLGGVFFGGLWLTVSRGLTSPKAALWFAASSFLRMALVLGGLYFVGIGSLPRLAACLLGFIVVRIAATRLAHLPRGERT